MTDDVVANEPSLSSLSITVTPSEAISRSTESVLPGLNEVMAAA
jgi:hypothetical protein